MMRHTKWNHQGGWEDGHFRGLPWVQCSHHAGHGYGGCRASPERPPAVDGEWCISDDDASAPKSSLRPAGTGQPRGSLMAASSGPRQRPAPATQHLGRRQINIAQRAHERYPAPIKKRRIRSKKTHQVNAFFCLIKTLPLICFCFYFASRLR